MLQKDLREFIELLNSEGVRYVIVGGYAVAFHGHPRVTGDIDVFVDATATNSSKMERVVRAFGFPGPGLSAADFAKRDKIVQLGLPPNRVDIITSIDAVTFDEAWSTRVEATLDDVRVNYISKELLLKNKAATGRAGDAADIERMQRDDDS